MNRVLLLGLSNFFEKNAASKYIYASEQLVGVAQICKMIKEGRKVYCFRTSKVAVPLEQPYDFESLIVADSARSQDGPGIVEINPL